jgi:hypothetical protein
MKIILRHRLWQAELRKDFFLAVVLVLSSAFTAEAQLRLQQLPRTSGSSKKNTTVRTQADPIQLPFFDDFSLTPTIEGTNTTGGIPLETHWEASSNSVYVNPGNGVNPPSINVATLDGLNRLGVRYSEQQLNNGFADTLVSQPIDLSILQVSLPYRDSVFFSFFYQRGGNAETPDRKDYLQLEFKDVDGIWVKISEYNVDQAPEVDEFYPAIVKVVGEKFFHDQFQFRLRNFGRLSGPFDAWHVDHFYLDNRRKDNMDIPDVTFTKKMSPLFSPYHSMPLKHFRESSHIEFISSGMFNARISRPNPGYRVNARFDNFMENGTLTSNTFNFVPPGGTYKIRPLGTDQRLDHLEHATFTFDSLPNPLKPSEILQFHPDAKKIDVTYEFIMALGTAPDLGPFKNNDTIRTTYHLDDYYAYDDGSAEYAAVLTNPGIRVAYAFDLIRTSKEPEFINGFDIYFPKWGVAQNVSPSFYIYDDDNGEPGEILWAISSLPISQLGQNQFQFVPTHESVQVNNRFYIGWEAPVGGLIAVGVDYNNNTGDKILYHANGVWNVNDAVLGSLMIRPHMGEGIISGIPEDTKASRAYPNPSQGTFYIEEEVTVLDVLSVSGQRIPATFRWEDHQTRITLNQPGPGMYILRTLKGNRVYTQKIVVSGTF